MAKATMISNRAKALLLPLAAVLLAAAAAPPAGGAADRARLAAQIRRAAAPFPELVRSAAFRRAIDTVVSTPRETFVAPTDADWAYRDSAVPIGFGQTISSPSTVTLMTAAAAIGPGSRVLEIGTGSGFQAAVLARLGAEVFTIEIVPELAAEARDRLARLGYRGITVVAGDGSEGIGRAAPFDAILVTAGSTMVPQALVDQLRVGGRLLMPIGPVDMFEQIILFTKRADGTLDRCSLGKTWFVPFTGKAAAPPARSGVLDTTTPYCFGGKRPTLDLAP